MLPDRLVKLVEKAQLHEAGHGVDAFGMSRDGVLGGLATTWLFYDHFNGVLDGGRARRLMGYEPSQPIVWPTQGSSVA